MRNPIRNERGAVLALVAVGMTAMMGAAGLALDSSRAYVVRAQLSRAVDAAALAGARAIRQGEPVAQQRAQSLAAANGVLGGGEGFTMDIDFGINGEGERTVTAAASRTVETWFMRIFGRETIDVASVATATVPPLDIVLVLDQSGSLESAGAWDDLQDAADDFLDYFSESIDQMGLVSFQIRGTHRFQLDQPFKTSVANAIAAMQSVGDTNTGEGLRLAREQHEGPSSRERAVRVVVFFTDGRPTAFRGQIGGQDRMMAVYTTHANGQMRGYFNNPDALPTDQMANASGCPGAKSCGGWNEPSIREEARELGLQRAHELREDGIFVFTIGLGNPDAADPILVPDMDYLRLLANESGAADGGQPQGRAYFAPSADELQAVFAAVAQDIVVRLTQ